MATFSEDEREFLEAFVKILHHLHNRAVRAEKEIELMKRELEVRREQVEHADLRPYNSDQLINAN